MTLPFTQIASLDFETYYDDVYSLRKMSTTDYLWDDRFEAQTCAVQLLGIDGTPLWPEAEVAAGRDDILTLLREIDWSTTALLGHHTQFDGLIATHHFGIYPCFWLCTMSMARAIYGTDSSVSLNNVAQKLGLAGKVKAQALVDVKGMHATDMTDETLEALADYNADDAEQTGAIFKILRPFMPDDELALLDLTIRMYAEPTLLIDGDRVAQVHADERARKAALFAALDIDVTNIRKNAIFAAKLEALGVDPPRKFSLRAKNPDGTPKEVYAFAKDDYEFKGLLEHADERVSMLVEARMGAGSNLVETRSASILRRVGRPTPIYLNYYGARTGRWSGGDGVNWQNLPKRGLGGELRKSLVAPDGHVLIISDASQIEARMLAWASGQQDLVDAFANGEDVYCLAASGIYGRLITPDDKDERFTGKVFTLGGGYGAGAPKINYMLKIGKFGPPVHQSIEETKANLMLWRGARPFITREWKNNNDNAKIAFLNLTDIDDGIVVYEGTKRGGYMHMPNGSYIFYPNVQMDDDGRDYYYVARNGPVKLYGGILTENKIQALARVMIGSQFLRMQEEMPDMRIATSSHDEGVFVVPIKKAERYAENVQRIMSTTTDWARGLPLNAETHISKIYDKS